ncbi:hypothetical protein COV56_03310, partial [Candidatus Kuenenbacteria bacterium CG11_big_fil_rev_8_21_14_0_20_37_9]
TSNKYPEYPYIPFNQESYTYKFNAKYGDSSDNYRTKSSFLGLGEPYIADWNDSDWLARINNLKVKEERLSYDVIDKRETRTSLKSIELLFDGRLYSHRRYSTWLDHKAKVIGKDYETIIYYDEREFIKETRFPENFPNKFTDVSNLRMPGASISRRVIHLNIFFADNPGYLLVVDRVS